MKSSIVEEQNASTPLISVKPKSQRNTKRKENYKSYKKKGMKSGRKCRICGNDPYPNYFFCPSCHHRIGAYEENEG